MKEPDTTRMAASAYMLWLGVAVAGGAYIHGGPRGLGMCAIVLAIIAATVHIRIGQARISDRVSVLIEVDRLNAAVRSLPSHRSEVR